MKRLFVCFIFSLSAQASVLKEFTHVNPFAIPGDTEYTHLPLPGIRAQESNDWAGQTDKYITGSGSLAAGYGWEHYAFSLGYKGRYVTPAVKTKNDEPDLDQPIGVYAEWVEARLDQSVTLYSDKSWGLKLDFGISYNDAGDHGFVNIYRDVHKALGNSTSDGKFGDKLYDWFIGTNGGAFIIIPFGDKVNLMSGYSVINTKPFRDDAWESSLVVRASDDFAVSLKYMYINQVRSEWYGDLYKKHRSQIILGLRFFKFWTPSAMYVSSFLKGDKHGQLYVSPVSFTYPF
mgnify:CR=1 FL=1